ncbi:MAG: hypothetical protein V1776_04565 [Candidatus Diapherotrites archaeon]
MVKSGPRAGNRGMGVGYYRARPAERMKILMRKIRVKGVAEHEKLRDERTGIPQHATIGTPELGIIPGKEITLANGIGFRRVMRKISGKTSARVLDSMAREMNGSATYSYVGSLIVHHAIMMLASNQISKGATSNGEGKHSRMMRTFIHSKNEIDKNVHFLRSHLQQMKVPKSKINEVIELANTTAEALARALSSQAIENMTSRR